MTILRMRRNIFSSMQPSVILGFNLLYLVTSLVLSSIFLLSLVSFSLNLHWTLSHLAFQQWLYSLTNSKSVLVHFQP